jgi:sRNA-binding protein
MKPASQSPANALLSYRDLAQRLIDAGLEIPTPLQWAVKGDIRPVSIGSHKTWREFGLSHGYSEEQLDWLQAALGKLVRSTRYLIVCARDGSERWAVDGSLAGPLDQRGRQAATEELERRKAKEKPRTLGLGGRPILSLRKAGAQ